METNADEEEVQRGLASEDLIARLARLDRDEIEPQLRAELIHLNENAELLDCGERERGIIRELEVTWRIKPNGQTHRQTLPLPTQSA
jgi:hypothetical protein